MAKAARKKDEKSFEESPESAPIASEQFPTEEIAEPTAPEPQQQTSEPEQPETEAHPPEDEPPAQPQRPRGRPPSKRSENSSTIIDRIQLIQSWENTLAYVYRHGPIIDRRAGGHTRTYVRVYNGPFDENGLLEDQGSGLYEIIVSRRDPVSRERKPVDSGMFRAFNMRYPPRVPKGEWVEDARNKDWAWAKEIWDKEEEQKNKQAEQQPNNGVGIMTPLLEMMREQNRANQEEIRALREVVLTKKPDEGGSTLVQLIAPILPSLIQRLMEPPKPDPTQALFMQYLMKQAETKPEAARPTDALAELDRHLELQKKLDEAGGGRQSARSRKTGTQEMITDIVAAAAPAVTPIMNVIAQGMLRAQQQAAQQPQPQFVQQQPPPQQQYQPPPAAPILPAGQQQPVTGPQIVKQQPTLEAFAAAVLDHLKRRADGFDLGDWYLDEFGETEFTDARTQGRDKLVSDLQSVPAWNQIKEFHETGELNKLITEFLTWEPADEDEEDDEEEAPPIAADSMTAGWNTPEQEPAR